MELGSHWGAPLSTTPSWGRDELSLETEGWCFKANKRAQGESLLAGWVSWGVPKAGVDKEVLGCRDPAQRDMCDSGPASQQLLRLQVSFLAVACYSRGSPWGFMPCNLLFHSVISVREQTQI